jgi:purine-binding chemotaxis protein CheW
MSATTGFNTETKNAGSAAARTYCSFRLGGGLFGVDALAVKEIAVLPSLTPIPHAPDAVRGCVNLRGQIVLVLDLNCLLHAEQLALGSDTRLVVFRASLGDPFGVLVDRIGDVVELSDDRIEKHAGGTYPSEARGTTPSVEALISGIGKLDHELLTILDARKLLPHIEGEIAFLRL